VKIEDQIKQLVANAAQVQSTGELCMAITSRLPPGTQIRITSRGVRVTHSKYIDKLGTAQAIDFALTN